METEIDMALDEAEKCPVCSKGKKGRASCSQCQAYYHLSCVSISAAEWESGLKLATKGFRWACQKCLSLPADQIIETKLETRMSQLEKKMEGSIKDLAEKIETSLTASLTSTKQALSQQEQQMDSLTKKSWAQVAEEVDRTVSKVSQEVVKVRDTVEEGKIRREKADKEEREKNVVIFGIKEAENHQADVLYIQDFLDRETYLHGLGIRIQPTDVTRIGRKMEDKTRPIKVTLFDRETKWEVLKRINRMELKGTFARPDLNREEQEADYQLRKALKLKREEEPDIHWKIVRGEIQKAPLKGRRREDSITASEAEAAQAAAEASTKKASPAAK